MIISDKREIKLFLHNSRSGASRTGFLPFMGIFYLPARLIPISRQLPSTQSASHFAMEIPSGPGR